MENRCRIVLEVVDTISSIWGARRIGIKICPSDNYNDSAVPYAEFIEVYTYLIQELMRRQLGYVNLSRRGCDVGRKTDDYFAALDRPAGTEFPADYEVLEKFSGLVKYPGSKTLLMVNHEYSTSLRKWNKE